MVSYPGKLPLMRFVCGCLNPYCSGQWSRTMTGQPAQPVIMVLILIVVDNGLVRGQICCLEKRMEVLILIVVDNGLVLDLIRPY